MSTVRDKLDYPHFGEIHAGIIEYIGAALKDVGYRYNLSGEHVTKDVDLKSEQSPAVHIPYFRVFLEQVNLDSENLRIQPFGKKCFDGTSILEGVRIPYILDFMIELVSDRYDDYLRILQALVFHILPRSEFDVTVRDRTAAEDTSTLRYFFSSHVNFEDADQFRSRFIFKVWTVVSQSTIESVGLINTTEIDELKTGATLYLDRDEYLTAIA